MSKKRLTVDKIHGIRAVGIVLKDSSVLLMRRENFSREYYTFPGGGVEENETPQEAVVRELLEETSISVFVKRLLYHHDLIGDSDHFFYECQYIKGEPQLGGEELVETKNGDIHEPLWVPASQLVTIKLFPIEVRDWLIADLHNGFQETPRVLRTTVNELKNS